VVPSSGRYLCLLDVDKAPHPPKKQKQKEHINRSLKNLHASEGSAQGEKKGGRGHWLDETT